MLKIRSPSFCHFVCKRLYHKGIAPFRQPHFLKSDKICIRDKFGEFSYQGINQESEKIARALVKTQINTSNSNSNVAFLTSNTHEYTVSQFGIWKGGLSCVPLCKSHPAETLKYYIEDSKASAVIISQEFADKIGSKLRSEIGNLLVLEELLQEDSILEDTETLTDNSLKNEDNAMLIYTSGTTGSPKGVVLTLNNVISQIECMIEPWGWSNQDKILHMLPLHHTHGIVNCLLCPLQVGASIDMLDGFDPKEVIDKLVAGEVNVFMAVPTVYAKLLEYIRKGHAPSDLTEKLSKNIRLMVSGSAALPQPIFDEWKNLTGHTLLERYGMTEIGMALTNPLKGLRKPGFVGHPFPSVEARIVDSSTGQVLVQGDHISTETVSDSTSEELSGDLQIRGSNVFKCYYGREEASKKEFTVDGWFKTGDTAQFLEQSFKILGRSSVDIIKSGGYKISALHVERLLLSHPDISDLAVVGLEDPVWGQKVAAVIVPTSPEAEITVQKLRQWGQDKMPKYLIPSEIMIMSEIPKNHMGKVNKKSLVKQAFPNN